MIPRKKESFSGITQQDTHCLLCLSTQRALLRLSQREALVSSQWATSKPLGANGP